MRVAVTPTGPVPGYRVAVTGFGAISCAGVGVEALWNALLKDTAPDEQTHRAL